MKRILHIMLLGAAIFTMFVTPACAQGTGATTGTVAATSTVVATVTVTYPSFNSLRRAYSNRVVTHVKTGRKVIAITYDDGPQTQTKGLMKVLRSYHAKATFFWTGRGFKTADILDVLKSGSEIGNHTSTHVFLTSKYNKTRLAQEIDRVDNQVLKIAGFKPTWVRAHGGHVDKAGLAMVVAKGHLYANWDIAPGDSVSSGNSAAQIEKNVLSRAHNGGIVDLHSTNPQTIKATPGIIKGLQARGYTLVTLSELAALGTPR